MHNKRSHETNDCLYLRPRYNNINFRSEVSMVYFDQRQNFRRNCLAISWSCLFSHGATPPLKRVDSSRQGARVVSCFSSRDESKGSLEIAW